MRALMCIFLLLAFPAANALFLAGQTEQGGAISVLCEGQRQAFLSLPSGELLALGLDSDFQAQYLPLSSGPHTIQCGKDTKTVWVSLPSRADSSAYSGGESLLLAAGAASVFLLLLASFSLAARVFFKPCTIFSKSVNGGQSRLFLRAGEDLRGIKITDPQGGEGGAPLQLSIPYLPAGAEWSWECECACGGPPIPACMSAKSAKGEVSIISCAGRGGMQMKRPASSTAAGKRKLKRAA